MELRDFIVTPLLLVIIALVAFYIRPYLADQITRKYFFPALAFKIVGAIALGLLYQYYYDGGDTYNFHTRGSRHIWEAFMNSPLAGLKLLLGSKDQVDIYQYSSRIPFYYDSTSFFVIRVAAIFDLITFSSYSGTSILFSLVSFAGAWALFYTFYQRYPTLHFSISLCTLFVPSVIFWGSGILKDTLVMACLGLATYAIDKLFIQGKRDWRAVVLLILSFYVVIHVKLFVLQAFIPAVLCWIFFNRISAIRSLFLKILIYPASLSLIVLLGYLSIREIGERDARYSIKNMARTAKITAYDIGFYSGRNAGSGYSLGELDGTFSSMLIKTPAAINVTLFRPYLWEVKNPLMLFSALEAAVMFFLFSYVLIKSGHRIISVLSNPDFIFAFMFSITIAFAVGITSYNFGTLARYKIPLIPYFTFALVLLGNPKAIKNFVDSPQLKID
ncbi:MAG: hypothetical protein JNL53_17525 [Cyclobacteriaceae bacterium]|nr:hypothetical protein [Cyclobacteriaceae bacterium]